MENLTITKKERLFLAAKFMPVGMTGGYTYAVLEAKDALMKADALINEVGFTVENSIPVSHEMD